MKKQWELLQKMKMKQIYWRHHALKKTESSHQHQFLLLQSLLWQQQLTIIVLVQFISYIQCSFNYMSDSQKSFSSSLNKSIKSTPSSLLVMQQSIIYMSISTLKSTEASHLNDMNVTDFLEAWKNICQDHGLIEKLMMQHLSLYCSDLIDEHIKSLSEYKSWNWEQLKEHLQKDYTWQNIKQQYYLRAYLEQYKQFFSKEDLCTYCL